jgi:hypothetical protein
MRLNAHFGELPSGAFEHCGDRKIKLQGGGGGFIDNIVDAVVDPIKDAGSWIDDKVNEEIPGGWYTVAAATGAYYAPEIAAMADAAEAAALAEGATAAEAANAGIAAAEAATASATTATAAEIAATDYLGSQALGSATTGAVGSGTTGFGLSAGTTTGGAAAGTGLSTGALTGMEYLGGAGSLSAGTAGLTAEQIAQAELAGQVGSNASSGLGYLGGAEALPSGTAGITGVTAPSSISIQQALRGANQLNNLFGQQQQPNPFLRQQVRPQGVVDYSPILSLLEQRVKTPNVYSLL